MKYEIRLSNAEKEINLKELILLLQTIRATYVMALHFLHENNYHGFSPENHFGLILISEFKRYISHNELYRDSIFEFSYFIVENDLDLNFSEITQNSPLKFVGRCSGISILALSLSVAISGGEVDLKNMKFNVKPFSESIVSVYEVFKERPKNNHEPKY